MPGYHGSWKDPPASASGVLGLKAFVFILVYFVCDKYPYVDLDKLVIFYILFKFFLMCLVLSFYSRQVELKKTCMGKFSPLTLAHRDWAQVTGFAPNNNFIFFF